MVSKVSMFEKVKKLKLKALLEEAEIYAKVGDLKKAVEIINKIDEVMNADEDTCVPCQEAKAKNLIAIIREMKKLLGV